MFYNLHGVLRASNKAPGDPCLAPAILGLDYWYRSSVMSSFFYHFCLLRVTPQERRLQWANLSFFMNANDHWGLESSWSVCWNVAHCLRIVKQSKVEKEKVKQWTNCRIFFTFDVCSDYDLELLVVTKSGSRQRRVNFELLIETNDDKVSTFLHWTLPSVSLSQHSDTQPPNFISMNSLYLKLDLWM